MLRRLVKNSLYILFLFSFSLLAGCLSDNETVTPVVEAVVEIGDGDSSGDGEATDNTVSGIVVKGPVDSAQVIIYEFDGITEIGRGTTNDDGTYSISIGDNAGGIVVSVTGGTYTDEATGATGLQLGSTPMRAAFSVPESTVEPFDVSMVVTPFSEIAVRDSIVDGIIDAQELLTENADFFGFDETGDPIDILTTFPSNPLTDSLNEGTDADTFGILLSVISQVMSTEGLSDWAAVIEFLDSEDEDSGDDSADPFAAALTELGNSDSAAGINISLAAVTVIVDAFAAADQEEGGIDGDSSQDQQDPSPPSGSVEGLVCTTGSPSLINIPSGLAQTVGDLTATFVAANSTAPFAMDSSSNFTFSSSGTLFVDNHEISDTPYSCGSINQIYWFEESMERIYEVSFTSTGSFNEVNLNSVSEGFQVQWTDENGDFANVTNLVTSTGSGSTTGSGSATGGSGTGDFDLTITGETTTLGITVTIPTIVVSNLPSPDPESNLFDVDQVLEDSGYSVNGAVDVTVINNTASQVTFRLIFEGSAQGVTNDYNLLYDYVL